MSETQEGELSHVIFELFFKNDQYERFKTKSSASMASLRNNSRRLDANLPIRSEIFFELFPFHVVIVDNLKILETPDFNFYTF